MKNAEIQERLDEIVDHIRDGMGEWSGVTPLYLPEDMIPFGEALEAIDSLYGELDDEGQIDDGELAPAEDEDEEPVGGWAAMAMGFVGTLAVMTVLGLVAALIIYLVKG